MSESGKEEKEEYEELIPALDLDVVIEIMKRLPIKSLLKLMSVSKQWKSIIQSSPFIADHNRIQPPRQFFVGFNRRNYAIIKEKKQTNKIDSHDYITFQQLLSLPRSDDFRSFKSCKLIGYSQGLFGFYNCKDRLVIWNPSIRKSVIIPLPERKLSYGTHDFGFTVVCNATEPTIFMITYEDDIPRLQVQIFTLSTGYWRRIVSNTPREAIEFTERMVVIDRFIHWIAAYDDRNTSEDDDSLQIYLIVSFDITSEQFTELCLPPTLAKHTDLDLSKLRESLVVLERDESKLEIGVWVMMEPGVQNSFTKQFTVNLPPDPSTRNLDKADVLGFTKDGQLIILIEAYPCKRTLLFYEPDLKCFKDIGKSGKKYSCLAGPYMETLLLLDH